jgi:hypothetical protein
MESNNLSIECLKNKKKVKLVKNKIWNEASYKTCFGKSYLKIGFGMELFKIRFWNDSSYTNSFGMKLVTKLILE